MLIKILIDEYRNLFSNKNFAVMRALKYYFCVPQFRVVVLIRCALKCKNSLIKKQYRRVLLIKYGVELGENISIGKNLRIAHYQGIVIGDNTVIGKNCFLYHQITLGKEKGKSPKLGRNVKVFPGAKVVGDVNIGDFVQIGTNAVVLKDVPSHMRAVGVPARHI